jgi:hypothetical protein
VKRDTNFVAGMGVIGARLGLVVQSLSWNIRNVVFNQNSTLDFITILNIKILLILPIMLYDKI